MAFHFEGWGPGEKGADHIQQSIARTSSGNFIKTEITQTFFCVLSLMLMGWHKNAELFFHHNRLAALNMRLFAANLKFVGYIVWLYRRVNNFSQIQPSMMGGGCNGKFNYGWPSPCLSDLICSGFWVASIKSWFFYGSNSSSIMVPPSLSSLGYSIMHRECGWLPIMGLGAAPRAFCGLWRAGCDDLVFADVPNASGGVRNKFLSEK